MGLEFRGKVNVFTPNLFVFLVVFFVDRFILCHLFKAIRDQLVVYSAYRFVTVIRMCVKGLRKTFVFNADYSNWYIFDFTNPPMIWKVFINLAELGDCDVGSAAG